jgi:1,4-alpha-glucan branching enzyme
MSTPLLIKNDPWLKSYEKAIKGRLDRARKLEKELKKSCDSISEWAQAHHFYGVKKFGGCYCFREWMPNAREVYLIGDFNGWQASDKWKFTKKGLYFEFKADLGAIKHADLYKLLVKWDGGEGERIPAYTQRAVQDEETKIFSAQIWDPAERYKWDIEEFCPLADAPIIYEAHVGMGTEEHKVGSYKEFEEKVLPRIKDGGYNTLQLMAIQEHPYYGSFGYHVSSFFAASSRFGTPEELKSLIDKAHSLGIAVIMDIVHSHAVKNELEGLGRYDGTDFQYFHGGGRGNHPAWDSKCFDYEKEEVLYFLLSNCRYWLEEYKFDGYRFDGVTSMIYLDHGLGRDFDSYDKYYDGAEDDAAISYLILANKVIREFKPGAITIAEEVSGMPGLASPLEYGGYGFSYRLAMGVPDFWIKLLKERRDEEWHVGQIFHELTQARHDESVISYAESHDQALVGDKTLAFRLMDKEMYFCMHGGFQSLIIDRGMALHKMIRLVTFSLAKNGYLNFMGNEFGHPEWVDFPREGNGWSFQHARRQWSLASNDELRYKYLDFWDKKMIETCTGREGYFASKASIIHENSSEQILAYERAGLVFIFNFNPTKSFPGYGLYLPKGDYKIILSADSKQFGGHMRVDESYIIPSKPVDDSYYAECMANFYIPSQTCYVITKI